MKKYGDEEIVEILNKYKEKSIGDVYSGIKIKGDLYHFHEYQFREGGVKIMLPLRFINMPEEIRNVKYGHMEKTDILMCSRDYNINFMLSFTKEELLEEQIEKTVTKQIEMLKMLQPAYEIYERGIEDNGYMKIGWFDYRASAIDVALYCMSFIFQVDKHMVIGKFICNIYKTDTWKPVMLKMLYSINNREKVLKEEHFGYR